MFLNLNNSNLKKNHFSRPYKLIKLLLLRKTYNDLRICVITLGQQDITPMEGQLLLSIGLQNKYCFLNQIQFIIPNFSYLQKNKALGDINFLGLFLGKNLINERFINNLCIINMVGLNLLFLFALVWKYFYCLCWYKFSKII
jgi:hypothetical protein